jgi:hypothetical protein
MNLCLRPLGIVALETGDMAAFQVALRSLCAFAIRLQSPVSFNKLAYQTAMCGIMNPLLEGKATLAQAVTALQVQLRKWLSGVSQDAVTDSLSTRTYSTKSEFQLARASLLYLVLKSDCHEMTLNVDATQIDHIYPKKPKAGAAPLANKDNCHRLGNFTPLVGSNSTGGMKGNCALGNCSFTEKVPHYTTSNLKMTRAVAERYGAVGVFLDEAIEERSRELAGLLATETAKELGL